MTEVLCNADSDWDIFTCRIIENFDTGNSIQHIAVIDEVFRGKLADTIQLAVTYTGCTTGQILKTKFIPDSEHLIFGIRQKNGHYLTRYGDRWHSGILNVRILEKYKPLEDRSKKYLECIRDYYAKVNVGYTGAIKLEVENYFRTTGYLKDGLPDGQWIHHNLIYNEDIAYKRTITYKQGRLHGENKLTYIENGNKQTAIRSTYDEGKQIAYKSYRDQRLLKHTQIKYEGSITYDTDIKYKAGEIHSQFTRIYIKNMFTHIQTKHGYYFNNSDKSYYGPKRAQGDYYFGARIGQWTFYNSTGEIDSIVTYSKPERDNDFNFLLYYEDGSPHIKGQIIDNLKEGLWQEYNQKGLLINEVTYHKDNYSGTTIRNNHISSEFKKSLQHGFTKYYNTNGDLVRIREYKKGVEDGLYLTYHNTNQIETIGKFKNGYAIGIHNKYSKDGHLSESKTYDDRGSLIQLKGYNSGRIITEGQYLNGYKSGHWKHYNGYNTYKSKFYPDDLEALMGGLILDTNEPNVEEYNPEIHSRRTKRN